MYFAITGKHHIISTEELTLVHPRVFPCSKKGIILFDTEYPDLLPTLGGCIKSGRVVKEKDLQELLKDIPIIGIQEDAIGKHLKRTIGIRRYKLVKLNHTDKEIKNKGKEIINLTNGTFGIVDHYQNIPLYETIDFDKPGRSMHMGMMPAKLAHILINLGILHHGDDRDAINRVSTPVNQNLTIYDPFCGSGTTCFLANALGYNTIGSDITIKYAEENKKRRESHKLNNKDHTIQFFMQDINSPLGRRGARGEEIIVTEGWLGPIITKQSTQKDIQEAQKKVVILYSKFIEFCKKENITNAVFTIPHYIGQENTLENTLQKEAQRIGYKRSSIPEIYAREEQQVGRKICSIKKS